MLEKYLELNWSLIPIASDTKKPLVPWKKYQTERADLAQIKKWKKEFKKCSWAVVTGKISDLTIVDLDNATEDDLNEFLSQIEGKPPVVKSPRGYHIYFRFSDVSTKINWKDKIDIRSEGGYCLLPPSEINGKKYFWIQDPFTTSLPKFKFSEEKIDFELDRNLINQYFVEGRRDNDLFHVAYNLFKAGVEKSLIASVIYRLAKSCSPAFPEKEAFRKVISALKFSEEKKEHLLADIRSFIDLVSGWFSVKDIFYELGIVNPAQKKHVYVILNRLVDEGVLQRHKTKAGLYAKVQKDLKPMSLEKMKVEPLNLHWPLDLENLISVYQKNIIVLAGVQNAGKTAFLLNFVKLNMSNYKIHYFNSEMSEEEFSRRLWQHEDVDSWNFYAYERNANFADVIFPDDINIIDYLMITDNFWQIGSELQKIHEKLNKGIAIIAIQKESYKDLGRGAGLGLDIPRIYFTMNAGELKIIKAKNWANSLVNPNGMTIKFKLVGGWKFLKEGVK